MIRIGDFSRISQVPVSTLRYYDEMGLLKPTHVDPFSGYRSYSLDQLPRLNRIVALKDLGFSLEEVARLLGDDLPLEQLRGMLRLKRAELRQQVQEAFARLEQVEFRLKQIEQENRMSSYDVVLKKVEPLRVASVRGVIPAYSEQGNLWGELGVYLKIQRVTPIGACFTLYHSDEPTIDAEVCEPIGAATLTPAARVQVRELPAVEQMATAVHHGPFTTIGGCYRALVQWIENNGYRICGPGREVYLQPPANASQVDPSTVTEIQFPVEKA